MTYNLNFFGIGISVECESLSIVESLKSDYGFFADASKSADWKIFLPPPAVKPARWWPAFVTTRSTVYWSRPGIRRVKFFGKCFVECDFNKKKAYLFMEDEVSGYESLYFVVESILSSELDEKRLHRLHGFGASIGGTSVVVLGKSGAGKSTLFANWCEQPESKFLGDDLVVTDGGGVSSYPAKISFKEMPTAFPRSDIREFYRQQYGLRFLLNARSVASRFEKQLPWGSIVLLRRARGVEKATLLEASRWRVFGWLVRWMVVGLETPQIGELFLPVSFSAVRKKLRHLLSRARRAWQISRDVPGYVYVAPEGPARMASFLRECLMRKAGMGKPCR